MKKLGEKLRWWRYWYLTRRVQRTPAAIAHRLPRWLKYWVTNDVVAEVTCYPRFRSIEVPSVTAVDVLEAYHRKLKREKV